MNMGAAPAAGTAVNLGWMLTRFTQETPGVSHVLAVSADGVTLAASAGLPPERVDQMAAIASGLAGLTLGAAVCMDGGGVRQTVVDMQGGLLIVMAVSDRAHLAILAASEADLGRVSYESGVLARRVNTAISPAPRQQAESA
jgi:predicted regulator of Ras-like GTPase activity (Roadblock/LC7/MglB family)